MNCIFVDEQKIEFTDLSVRWEGAGVRVQIDGDGNEVAIGRQCKLNNVVITITGDDNSVRIGSACLISNSKILLNVPADKRKVMIKKKTSIGGAVINLTSHENLLDIGEECMFSNEIIIRTEDGHPIYDLESKKLYNKGGKVIIGNHCWIGERAYILKDVVLLDDTVVGACSVVTKSFEKSNIVVAGIPAKIVKEGIGWKKNNIHNYKE